MQTGETGTENRRVLFEVEVLGRSHEEALLRVRLLRLGRCTQSAPGAATTAGTPASSHVSEVMVTWDDHEETQEVRGGEGR